MRNSRRIKRMSRNRAKVGKMDLTSMMDVFTILVFFLLVNTGSVQVMEAPKAITLPESRVDSKPRETVVIFISEEQVLVQGKAVATVSDILAADRESIASITDRLAEVGKNVIGPATRSVAGSQEVTILADKQVPFAVIKRIMSVCTGQGYSHLSLAVIQTPSKVQSS